MKCEGTLLETSLPHSVSVRRTKTNVWVLLSFTCLTQPACNTGPIRLSAGIFAGFG